MRIITKFFLGILFIAIGCVVYYKGYINISGRSKLESAATVQTIHPSYKDISHKRVFRGNIVPYKEVEVYSNIFGNVEKLFVKIGDHVEKGMPIAQIIQKYKTEDVEKIEREVRLKLMDLEKIKKIHLRKEYLFNKKMLAKEDYENSLADFNKARESLNNAKKQLQNLKLGYVKEKGIGSTIIKAPIKGTILDIPIKEGCNVMQNKSGGLIALIGDMDRFLFTAQVKELDVVHLRKGMSFNICLNVFKNEKFKVTLTNISPTSNCKNNDNYSNNGEECFSIEGIVTVPPSHKTKHMFRAGYSALAEIIIEQAKDVLAIPENLIQTEEQLYFVWCLHNNKKVKKYIELGLSDGLYVEVKQGLTEEDLLIIEEE